MRGDDQDHGRRLRAVIDEVVANTDVHGSLPFLTCAVPSWAAVMVPSQICEYSPRGPCRVPGSRVPRWARCSHSLGFFALPSPVPLEESSGAWCLFRHLHRSPSLRRCKKCSTGTRWAQSGRVCTSYVAPWGSVASTTGDLIPQRSGSHPQITGEEPSWPARSRNAVAWRRGLMKCYHRTGGIGTSFAMVTGVSRPSPFAGNRTWDRSWDGPGAGGACLDERVYNYH